jgi:hypothetical protein
MRCASVPDFSPSVNDATAQLFDVQRRLALSLVRLGHIMDYRLVDFSGSSFGRIVEYYTHSCPISCRTAGRSYDKCGIRIAAFTERISELLLRVHFADENPIQVLGLGIDTPTEKHFQEGKQTHKAGKCGVGCAPLCPKLGKAVIISFSKILDEIFPAMTERRWPERDDLDRPVQPWYVPAPMEQTRSPYAALHLVDVPDPPEPLPLEERRREFRDARIGLAQVVQGDIQAEETPSANN